jgi:hypothetical protein
MYPLDCTACAGWVAVRMQPMLVLAQVLVHQQQHSKRAGSDADAAGDSSHGAAPAAQAAVDPAAGSCRGWEVGGRREGFLLAGDYFGEFSCLLSDPSSATFRAASFCVLYSLTRADLAGALHKWWVGQARTCTCWYEPGLPCSMRWQQCVPTSRQSTACVLTRRPCPSS